MATFNVEFTTKINLVVAIDAEDEETAADLGWEAAEAYLNTLNGEARTSDGTGYVRTRTKSMPLDSIPDFLN